LHCLERWHPSFVILLLLLLCPLRVAFISEVSCYEVPYLRRLFACEVAYLLFGISGEALWFMICLKFRHMVCTQNVFLSKILVKDYDKLMFEKVE
jgi:hypothetical protein